MDFNTGGGSSRPEDDRPLYGGEASGAGRGPAGGPEPGPAGGLGSEFNLGDPVGSFISTVRRVLLEPTSFFRGIARRGDFVNPLVFAVICALISGLLGGILALIVSPLLASPGQTEEALAGGVGGLVGGLILTPIFTAIGLFVFGAIFHLLVMLFVRPSNSGFEATFRVGAYASVTQLVSWLSVIPILGVVISLVVLVYGVFLGIVGIREMHSTTTGRAAAVVLIPVGLLILLILIFGVLLAALLVGVEQQQF